MTTTTPGRSATLCTALALALTVSAAPANAQTATDERVNALEQQLNQVLQQLQAIQRKERKTRLKRPKNRPRGSGSCRARAQLLKGAPTASRW